MLKKSKWKPFSKLRLPPSEIWLPYLLLSSFIIGWWLLAFRSTTSHSTHSAPYSQPLEFKTSTLLAKLSPLQRDALQRALAGDFPLMLEFIGRWDKDAQLLANEGINGIQRLPKETYFQAKILGHLLQHSSPELLRQLNCKMNQKWLQDDLGNLLHIEDTFQRFLPQTFVAASFLLAMAHPSEIIALPKGMRHLSRVYPAEIMKEIPSDIDRINSEKLYSIRPHLAFVAPYSHPPALEALRNQNIQLYTIQSSNCIADIREVLLKIGHASNHILEAQLLAIFMESSFLSIENRLITLNDRNPAKTPSRLLYLDFHQHYLQPTTKSLTGQLMSRALQHCPHLSCPIPKSEKEWRIPFEWEKILNVQPDFLIISIPDGTDALHQSMLHATEIFRSKPIYYIDEAVQESPTQYIVLAYFDLFQAIACTYLKGDG